MPAALYSPEELQELKHTPVKAAAAVNVRSPSFWTSPKKAAPLVAFAPAPPQGNSARAWVLGLLASAAAMLVSFALTYSEDATTVTEVVTQVRFARELDGLSLAGTCALFRPPLFAPSVFAAALYADRRSYCADAAPLRAFVNTTAASLSWLSAEASAKVTAVVLDSAGSKVLLLQTPRAAAHARFSEVLVGAEPTPTLSPIASKLALLTDADFTAGSIVRISWQNGWLGRLFRLEIGGKLVYVGGSAEGRAVFERVLAASDTASTRLVRSILSRTPALCGWG
ncbi:hypothetical protein KFE25_004256 [Diacronema lutheri]|uniref:Uncharacterized protein n=1 Tax=Diacronema lutheri TaxID=2081491 RepID=A0A8J5X9A3_DIALT|nr:hypothetical protein KFE25_004256 [Diacronema lutheri]